MSRLRRRRRGERGAVLILMTVFIVVIFIIVAVVIDLGATRSDRREGQLAVDNGTSTAAQTLRDTGNPQTACADAVDIAEIALGVTLTGTCSSLPTTIVASCTSLSPAVFTGGEYTLRVHYPVLDSSPLMARTSTINNTSIASGDDGDQCRRIGVEVTTTGDPFFGQIAGSTQRTSTVHAVAKVTEGTTELRPLNLLSLDRTSCPTLDISGQGDVVVAGVLDPLTGRYSPGTAAADSDASRTSGGNNCNGNSSVIEAGGTNAVLRADGPCAADPTTQCQGTGQILSFAPIPGDGSCASNGDVHACRETNGATITPNLEQLTSRFTRAPLDYRYNCKASYATEPWFSAPLAQDIPGCTGTGGAYHDGIETFLNISGSGPSRPAGWTQIQGADCSPSDTTFLGNVYVNCNNFQPSGTVRFENGNVIFKGRVTMNSNANLFLHACPAVGGCTDTLSWTPGSSFNANQSSANAAWVYVHDRFTMNSGLLDINMTTMFFGRTSWFEMTGGDIDWTAPNSTATDETPFDDLAMWSEGTNEHSVGGNGSIFLVGVFFNGQSTFKYAGDTAQTLDQAQFVANRLRFTGQGRIVLSPDPDDSVEFPVPGEFNLIR